MLSKEDNELVTNTDPNTPMGDLLRRFWVPVALSDELPGPDCVPTRLKILDEQLIAFRDSDGRVGLMDAFCPHRGAPMFFGRNEESGLRCVYHGWKFDVDGNCTDIPNAPEGESFRLKINAKSYACVEAGDLIWAYMGPKDKKPPFPELEWTAVPRGNRYVSKFQMECNWLQAMEGDFDPSHAIFLHSSLDNGGVNSDGVGINPNTSQTVLRTPTTRIVGSSDPGEAYPRAVGNRRVKPAHSRHPSNVELDEIDSALFVMSQNELPDGRQQAVAGLIWHMPFFCPPGVTAPGHMSSNMRIPVDNEHCMFFRMRWSLKPMTENELQEYKYGGYTYPELVPGTWQTKANVFNDYEIDRVVQRNFSYTGIRTFPLQDIAMMENQWGPIADRSQEHLTSMDYQIIHIRRRLLKAARALEEGTEPTEPWRPESFRYHSARVAVDDGASLDEAFEAAKRQAMTPLLGGDIAAAGKVAAQVPGNL